ncbi:hypothetical protein R0J92_27045, partial [Tritonibacter sp. SIMBA_163]
MKRPDQIVSCLNSLGHLPTQVITEFLGLANGFAPLSQALHWCAQVMRNICCDLVLAFHHFFKLAYGAV